MFELCFFWFGFFNYCLDFILWIRFFLIFLEVFILKFFNLERFEGSKMWREKKNWDSRGRNSIKLRMNVIEVDVYISKKCYEV